MPPRVTRSRGGAGTTTGSHHGLSTEGESVITNTATAGGLPQPQPYPNSDTYHNTDQPCCFTLTRIAQLIFPSKVNGKNSHSNIQDLPSNGIETNDDVMETHPDWYTLLRGYLVLERMNQKEENSSAVILSTSTSASNKKKKKKKRKKKGDAITIGVSHESMHDSATEFFDATEQEEDGEENETTGVTTITTTPTTSATSKLTQIASSEVEPPLPNIPIFQPESPPHRSSLEWDQRLQQERLRRINQLMNRFIDHTCIKTGIDTSTIMMNDNMRSNIQQLHGFIGTFRNDDQERTPSTSIKGTTIVLPNKRNQSDDHCPPNVISRKQIEAELQNICCEACRKDVKRILLPPLTRPSSSPHMMIHPPSQQLLLQNLIIPTMYDTIDQELEMEQRATEYQTLMEEGVTPPAHTRSWSFHILTQEERSFESNTTASTTSSIAAMAMAVPRVSSTSTTRPQCVVQGWILHRPMEWSPQRSHVLDVVPELSLSEVPTNHLMLDTSATGNSMNSNSANGEWTMSQLKFLIDQYVLLLGLSPDEIVMSTEKSSTTPSIALTTNEFASISSNVSGKVRTLTYKFHDLATMIELSYQQFVQSKQYQVENDGCTTDWQTFAVLKDEIDETCRVVMNALLNINIDITCAVHRVVSHMSAGIIDDASTITINNNKETTTTRTYMNTRNDVVAETKWATAHCQAIWQAYVTGCISMIQEREKYEAKLLELVEERVSGKCIPDMMVSPAARSLYSAFINIKLGIVVNTMQMIERQLNASTYIGGWHTSCSTNTNATFVARLYTEDLFFTVINGLKESDHTCPEIDQSFGNILKTIREMTDTVYEQKVDVVLEKYQQQRDKLHRIITRTTALLDGETAPILILLRLELAQIQNIQWHSDAKNKFSQLQSAIMKAIEIWIHYRLDYTVPGFTKQQPTPIMPYELRRSMRPDTTVLFNEQTQQCRGGNEQHRAICILIGLFFDSLSERFKEWQAQRAAQELLTAMVDDVEGDAILPTTPKTSKKQKKKGKKNVLLDDRKNTPKIDSVPQNPYDVITDSDDDLYREEQIQSIVTSNDKEFTPISNGFEQDNSLLLDNAVVCKDVKQDDGTMNETATSSENSGVRIETNANLTNTIKNGTTVSTERSTVDVPLESSVITTTLQNDIAAETSVSFRDDVIHSGQHDTDEVKSELVLDDAKCTVGVFDTTLSDGFQSAEDFLIGRFHQIIQSNERIVVIP